MVSIGTLFAFFMVAASLFFYRLYDQNTSTKRQGIIALVHLLLIVAASLGKISAFFVIRSWFPVYKITLKFQK